MQYMAALFQFTLCLHWLMVQRVAFVKKYTKMVNTSNFFHCVMNREFQCMIAAILNNSARKLGS